MLVTDSIMISITSRNVNHYREKGYDIPMKYSEKMHKEVIDSDKKISVTIRDLPECSHQKIQYTCDCCGRLFSTDYNTWCHTKHKELGDLCKECAAKIKLPKAMIEKYGYENPSNVPSVIEKKKQTNMDKYGSEWAISSSLVRDEISNSYIDRYGVSNPMKNESIKKKTKKTNNKKYGGNSPMCDKEVRAKSRQTCLDRYGVENAFQSKDIQEKARITLYKNKNTPTSKAEKQMCRILKNIFGKNSCYPSYPVGNLSLDCLVVVDGVNIDFEYDGMYWHKDRQQKDAARNAILMNEGYRIVRIKANNQDEMPTIEQIKDAVKSIIEENRHLVFIDMNN